MRTSKEKEAEAKAERNASRNASKSSSSSPPPEYAQAPPDYDAENRLVPPDVTAGFAKLNLNSANTDTPQVDRCVAHLKVLECFYRLRQTVGSKDGLFGIDNSIALGKGLPSSDQTPQVLAKLSEKRWAIYVSRAVDRFERWYESLLPSLRYSAKQVYCVILARSKLHSFSLRITCLQRMYLWCGTPTCSIRGHTLKIASEWVECNCGILAFHGRPPSTVSTRRLSHSKPGTKLRKTSQTPPACTGTSSTTFVQCPACFKTIKCAYTTAPEIASLRIGSYSTWDSLSLHVDDLLSSGTGFCDRQFVTVCPHCATDVTHDRLKVAKFCCDLQRLAAEDLLMGSTLLSLWLKTLLSLRVRPRILSPGTDLYRENIRCL